MVDHLRTDDVRHGLLTSEDFKEALGFLQLTVQHSKAASELDGRGMFSHHAASAVANFEQAAAKLGFELAPRAEGKDVRAP